MLICRVITASILIPLVLAALFMASNDVFRWVNIAIFTLIGIEWGRLCQFKQKSRFVIFLITLMSVLFFLPISPLILWIGTLLWIILLYCCITYTQLSPALRALIGWLALPCAYQGLIILRGKESGEIWILCLFLLIWASDIFAYFTGKAWGHRRLAAKISPNKTQEGLLGAVTGAMFVAGIEYYFLTISSIWFIVALVTILLGVLGDLFESLLKRLANVKDSGQLLPGHGGAFDRLDSLIAALPFYALCLDYLLR